MLRLLPFCCRLPVFVGWCLYAEHISACMHSVWSCKLWLLLLFLFLSSPGFSCLPSPSTAQSSQALGTAWGEAHVWLPGTPKQQQLTPPTLPLPPPIYTASVGYTILQRHTAPACTYLLLGYSGWFFFLCVLFLAGG